MGACGSAAQQHNPVAVVPSIASTWALSRDQFILQNAGDIADHYGIDPRKLGQGTFGVVHMGEHKATGSQRAIKIVSRKNVRNMEDFRQEVAIMKALDHPNIIRLYETFEDDKNVYLAMELCHGGELFDRVIALGSLSERQAAIVLRHVIRAVSYMHEKDVAHRDLKPENFLFASAAPIDQNVLKVIDFGTACRAREHTIMTNVVGTRFYIAPQVLMRRYDRKCDLWSCGAIMYTLLCGRPPFTGRTEKEVVSKVRLGRYSFAGPEWAGVSEDAKGLIRSLMNVNPRARYSARQALAHVWIREKAPGARRSCLQDELVENLRGFHAQNRLKKAALQIIAGQLKGEQVDRLIEVFLCLDADSDGSITFQDLREGLRGAGLENVVDTDLEMIVKGIDVNRSGAIDYTEFLAAALNRGRGISESDCLSAFTVFDVDGDGMISPEDLTQVLDLGRRQTSSQELLRSLDCDGDGGIDFEEFTAMMGLPRGLGGRGGGGGGAGVGAGGADWAQDSVCKGGLLCKGGEVSAVEVGARSSAAMRAGA